MVLLLNKNLKRNAVSQWNLLFGEYVLFFIAKTNDKRFVDTFFIVKLLSFYIISIIF